MTGQYREGWRGGNPAGAKTKAQELIERDKVNVIVGPLGSTITPQLALCVNSSTLQTNILLPVKRVLASAKRSCHDAALVSPLPAFV
jgi:hypothetical protein